MPPPTSLTRLRRRLRALLRRGAVERELDEELRFHLDMEIEHNMRQGDTPAQARRRAEREFGGVARIKEEARDARGTRGVEDAGRDLRVAWRALRRTPAYTLVALLTLALGIGVTTAAFSVVDGVLLRPLPYPEPDRLVQLFERTERGTHVAFAGANVLDVERESRALETVAFFGGGTTTVLGADQPLRVQAALVSHDFFAVLGVRPQHGRTFDASEGGEGRPAAAVISHRFWQTALGGDPAWAERTLRLASGPTRIVGIMPPGFHFPDDAELWSAYRDENPHRTAHNWSVVGRLAPGTQPERVQQELDPYFAALKVELGSDVDAVGVTVERLHDRLAGKVRSSLLVLMGAVSFVLLIACVNLASAGLARGESRQRELAVRAALGAGRGRLVRQLLTESVLLAAAGGLLGVAVAWVLVRLVSLLGPGTLPGFAQVQLDARVLAFAAAAALATGLLVGIAPALLVTRDLRGAIGQGSAGGGGRRRRARSVLIGAEVAFALALLVGAGLLVRSLDALLEEDLGFRTERMLTVDLALPSAIYGDAEGQFGDTVKVAAFFDRLLPAVRALPGVESASFINQVPLGGGGMGSGFMVDGGTEIVGGADYRIVDSAYFATLGIPLLRGRGLQAEDRAGAPHAVVINRAMAERFWPGELALGHRIRLPGMDAHREEWLTVVGVVEDVRHSGLDRAPTPTMFIHYAQRPERLTHGATVVVRATGAPAQLTAALRRTVREVDANVPVEISSLQALVDRSLATRRFSTLVLTGFALLALFLAAIGIYGVLAYSVTRRQREIGVRMALGAHHGRVRVMVLRDAMLAVLPGVAVGLLAALALTRVLRGMLYGVSEGDPVVFGTVPAVLIAVAVAASWIPARRATRVNPMIAIRSE